MMESISSNVRLSLLPYSAAQQPVQCRLQALVGSSRMVVGGGVLVVYGLTDGLTLTGKDWGPSPANLSTMSITWVRFFDGVFFNIRKSLIQCEFLMLSPNMIKFLP